MSDIVERLRLLVPSDSSGAAFDAVDEITALRAENEKLSRDYQSARDAHDKLLVENDKLKTAIQRQAIAVRTLEYCKKAEINILRQTHQQAHVAAMTLDSERDANAILTEENERLRAALNWIANVPGSNLAECVNRARAALGGKDE